MKQLVIMPGGFHPFHAGHAALYQSAVEAFPGADVYVAATNDTSTRPFPFPVKEKLAQLAGVAPNRFVQVKSPFRAEEIVHKFDPNNTQLIFVRSEKDAGSQPRPGGTKKDGTPSYLQPYDDSSDQPLSQRAYMAYLPTVEFGPGMTSATEIRGAWPRLNEKRKTALVMSLYPKTQVNPKLAATVVKLLDTAMGTVDESALDNLPRPNKRNQFKSLHKQRKQRGLDEQGVAEDNLKEFAPGSSGGESGRWYTDDQMTDIVGDGWYNDLDVSGDIPKQQMIQQAQDWLDDQGYSVQVLNCKVNDDDMEWYIEGSFYNPRFAKKGVVESNKQIDELFEPTLNYYTLSNGKKVQVSYRPNPNQSPVPFTDVTVSYVDPALKPMGPSFDSTGVAQPWTSAPDGVKQAIQKFVTKPSQGVAEMGGQNFVGGMTAGYQRKENQPVSEGPFVQRIMHPGKVNIYVRSGKVPKLVATDIPYEILDRYITKVIAKYPQFKPSDFSFESSDKVSENQGWAATYENTAPNPRVDLTPNYPNYATLVGEFIGIKKNRALFRVIAAELRPGQGETEKIFRAMTTNTPIGIEIGKVKNRAVLEALKPDAFAALQQAKQNIEQNRQQAKQRIEPERQQEVDQWAQDFRANSAKLAGQQLKQRFAEPLPEPPIMPVVQPGESPAALRDRLAQLNIAKQKFEEINALIKAIKNKYQHSTIEAEMNSIEKRLEIGLLPDVKAGVTDNYKSLLAKLDNLRTSLTTRFIVKEAPDYIDEYNNR